jgi:hypothetical protein
LMKKLRRKVDLVRRHFVLFEKLLGIVDHLPVPRQCIDIILSARKVRAALRSQQKALRQSASASVQARARMVIRLLLNSPFASLYSIAKLLPKTSDSSRSDLADVASS